MKKLVIAIAAALLAACVQAPQRDDDPSRPRWLRDPARGEYPYNAPWF